MTEVTVKINQKCSRCYNKTTIDNFTRNGKIFKTCNKCSANRKPQRINGDKLYAIKNKDKMRLYKMVSNAKKHDQNYNIYDANTHVDRTYIKQLIFDQDNKCIYYKKNNVIKL